jgi:hypothetical protein
LSLATAASSSEDVPQMQTPLNHTVTEIADLSHEARRFRTILRTFESNLDQVFRNTALTAEVDHAALASAFAKWRQRFDETKHLANTNRHDFVIFAAGLMLKELVAAAPIKTVARAQSDAALVTTDHRLARWPEGYAYTSFCLSVATAILHEMGESGPEDSGPADDPAFWDSFKENTESKPETAIAFFDLVCGQEPNWDAPDVPWMRRALKGKSALLGR